MAKEEHLWLVPILKNVEIKHNEMILEYEHPMVGTVKTTAFPVSFSDTPQKIHKPAPLLNQHAAEILKEYCNYTEEEIHAFQIK